MKLNVVKPVGLLALLVALSGCVQYRMGLDLAWDGSGTISQNLQVEPILADLVAPQLEDLTQQLQNRATKAGGRLRHKGASGLFEVVIPFQSLGQVEDKLNRFFSDAPKSSSASAPQLTRVVQSFRLEEHNFFLVTYYHLTGVLDLSELTRQSFTVSGHKIQVQAEPYAKLQLSMTLPFGALSSNANRTEGSTLLWNIRPNQPNELTLNFLLPGIPGVMLLLLGLAGTGVWLTVRR
ncbi:DUF3153 domain-containing protein [Anthocerotibacter panamensis]|uniref:DUF3153 domain-containing protein n=1 Tax=Anthocerotibacter panamensis TaxID=2857077 RepID=UPI001C4050AF|nr:DUF3153 domain-containing protein [Anthocerotibacter panamensis]